MTDDRSLERAARMWLEDGPTAAPDRVVDSALARIETTHQERGQLVPWRLPHMSPAMKVAGAAVLVVAAVAGSVYLFGNGGGIGAAPTPTPIPSAAASAIDARDASATPTAAPSPFDPLSPSSYRSWATHASEIYGTRIGYPEDWTVIPATRAWDFETDAADALLEGTDGFVSPDGDIRVSVWTVPVPEGTILRDWVASYCDVNTTPCEDMDERLDPALRETADRHLVGAIIEFTDDVQAFMPSWAPWDPDTTMDAIWTNAAPAGGGEITIVAAWRPPNDYNARDLVDGFSLQLCPDCEEAAP